MNLTSRFSLRSIPFTRELSVEDRFVLAHFEQELQFLKEIVENRMSAALIAPAGTGKTLLLRTLKKSLPEARFKVHYIKVTGLSKRDMCREICMALGAKPAGTYASLVRAIQEHLLNCFDIEGMRPVILVDEAHDMRPSVLAMLRLITNFEYDSRLVVSLILAGQPQLKNLFRQEELEAITKRLSHCSELRLLSRDEARSYLEHRIRIVGANAAFPFDKGACEALFELTRGNIRALDELARKSMEMADQSDSSTVNHNHVLAAREKLPV